MKTIVTHLIGIFLVFFSFGQVAEAQILQTKSEIIATYGEPFSSGVNSDGENYLYYKIPVTTKNSGTYNQCRVLVFKPSTHGEEICYKWKILEPATETNYNITSFTKDLVQVGDMKWKDFDKGIFYTIENVNKICKITAWYENDPGLVRVYKF